MKKKARIAELEIRVDCLEALLDEKRRDIKFLEEAVLFYAEDRTPTGGALVDISWLTPRSPLESLRIHKRFTGALPRYIYWGKSEHVRGAYVLGPISPDQKERLRDWYAG